MYIMFVQVLSLEKLKSFLHKHTFRKKKEIPSKIKNSKYLPNHNSLVLKCGKINRILIHKIENIYFYYYRRIICYDNYYN